MSWFVALGVLAALAGLVVLVMALKSPEGEPKRTAMLIGGTMLSAFGIVIAGFAIAYQSAAPLALNAAAPTP